MHVGCLLGFGKFLRIFKMNKKLEKKPMKSFQNRNGTTKSWDLGYHSRKALGGLKETKMFLPHPVVKLRIVRSLRDREVACSASDLQGLKFKSCVQRAVSSHSSHHPQEVLLAQFSLYVHKSGLKSDSFNFFTLARQFWTRCNLAISCSGTFWKSESQ